MREKHYFILEHRGGDCFDKKLETSDLSKAIKAAIDEWDCLTWREQRTTRVELVEGYSLEDDEQELDLSAYNPIWSSDKIYIVDLDNDIDGGDYEAYGTIEDAQRRADELATYCQRDMDIYAPDGVYSRRWWGTTEGIEDCEDPIQFGSFGYYGDWELQEYSGATFDSYADLIKKLSF